MPVMVEPEGAILCDGTAIAEYLDECFPQPPLLPYQPSGT